MQQRNKTCKSNKGLFQRTYLCPWVLIILTYMSLKNNFRRETCLHFKNMFKQVNKELIESIIAWCNHNQLKINTSKTNELVVDYSCLVISFTEINLK